jgi:hypothetical protein
MVPFPLLFLLFGYPFFSQLTQRVTANVMRGQSKKHGLSCKQSSGRTAESKERVKTFRFLQAWFKQCPAQRERTSGRNGPARSPSQPIHNHFFFYSFFFFFFFSFGSLSHEEENR